MVNGMNFPFIFEHKNLVFQVLSWLVNVCFDRSILWTGCLGDGESFACLCDLTIFIVEAEVRECRREANRMPGCAWLRWSSKAKEVHRWYKIMRFIAVCVLLGCSHYGGL